MENLSKECCTGRGFHPTEAGEATGACLARSRGAALHASLVNEVRQSRLGTHCLFPCFWIFSSCFGRLCGLLQRFCAQYRVQSFSSIGDAVTALCFLVERGARISGRAESPHSSRGPGSFCYFDLLVFCLVPHFQEDKATSRVTLGNLGRSLSAKKRGCIVLAVEARVGPNSDQHVWNGKFRNFQKRWRLAHAFCFFDQLTDAAYTLSFLRISRRTSLCFEKLLKIVAALFQ